MQFEQSKKEKTLIMGTSMGAFQFYKVFLISSFLNEPNLQQRFAFLHSAKNNSEQSSDETVAVINSFHMKDS